MAAKKGYRETVSLLLKLGVDVHEKDYDDRTVIAIVENQKNMKIAELLSTGGTGNRPKKIL